MRRFKKKDLDKLNAKKLKVKKKIKIKYLKFQEKIKEIDEEIKNKEDIWIG